MEVLFFGQLTDITGVASIEVAAANNTDTLEKILIEKYPGLLVAKYRMAVNKVMVQGCTTLMGQETIALMPPFSGG